MSMLGLRDLVLIAQTPSSLHQQNQPISTEHHANLPLPSSAASLSVGLGFFPLLTATPCMPQSQNNDVQECDDNPNYWNLKMCPPQQQMNSSRKGVMINVVEDDERSKSLMGCEENGVVYGSDFRVCQDCGNKAKKDCSHKRCRTCCKGRGFDCSTHVKSTWVPASLRRDRNMVVADGGGCGGGDSDGGTSSGAKRQRVLGSSHNAAAAGGGGATSHSSTSNATTTRSLSLDTSSCHQDAGFKQSLPRHVHAPAVFKCHRVSAIGNGEDEFAYLATVHISGHVFKGFLYDQGVDGKSKMPCVSELQLGNNGGGKSNRECSSAIGVPTTSAYPASAC